MALVLDSFLYLFRLDIAGKGNCLVDLARTCFHLVIVQNILQHGVSSSGEAIRYRVDRIV